ncbi:IS200/IS605 family accessory protein TnpB-related protein [Streptomyces sp. NPDC005407]|uniref:IS200/IS605 family accessory protein TnpB-related protein n=1 Tax=Streptomyces sp. NPDC005407 TaxID=3155340 RepID=UPI0033A45B50
MIATVTARLARPLGTKSRKRRKDQPEEVAGYGSRQEWHAKCRRLATLQTERARVAADLEEGRVHVVRGGNQLLRTRLNLDQAGLTELEWQGRWEAARMFLAADGESGKAFGNETIRITPHGLISVKLPAALRHLANAPRGRYALGCAVTFRHRDTEWRNRIIDSRAVAYRIHHDPIRDRWYVTATWASPPAPVMSLDQARAAGCVGVDMNDDHLAAWRLDVHGNPVGSPECFSYNLSGSREHRDAQIRHALTRLLRWARQVDAKAIVVEDLDFADGKSREKFGRNKRFRRLISRFPTARLRARLTSMAAGQQLAVVAVNPAYTSIDGARYWQQPTSSEKHQTTRHEAASLVIGRRGLGHGAKRRAAPPRCDRSDRSGHRTTQASNHASGREGLHPHTCGPHPPEGAAPRVARKRTTRSSSTVRDDCSGHTSAVATEQEWCQGCTSKAPPAI